MPSTIRQGSTGPDVALLHRLLALPVADQNTFTAYTKTAVQAFQRSRGLTPDGIVGPLTWAALGVPANATTTQTTPSIFDRLFPYPSPTGGTTGGGSTTTPGGGVPSGSPVFVVITGNNQASQAFRWSNTAANAFANALAGAGFRVTNIADQSSLFGLYPLKFSVTATTTRSYSDEASLRAAITASANAAGINVGQIERLDVAMSNGGGGTPPTVPYKWEELAFYGALLLLGFALTR